MTSPSSALPGDEPPRPYRLSDQERSEAISALGDAYAAGRLDVEEFESRMALACQARLATDLDPLFADLPHRMQLPVPAAAPERLPGQRLPGQRRVADRQPEPAQPWQAPWHVAAWQGAAWPPAPGWHPGAMRPRRGPRFPVVPLLVVLLLVTHAWVLVPILVVGFVLLGGPHLSHARRRSGRHAVTARRD